MPSIASGLRLPPLELFIAVECGHLVIVKNLIRAGAVIDGGRPLFVAALYGQHESRDVPTVIVCAKHSEVERALAFPGIAGHTSTRITDTQHDGRQTADSGQVSYCYGTWVSRGTDIFFELGSVFINATLFTNARAFLREHRTTGRGGPGWTPASKPCMNR